MTRRERMALAGLAAAGGITVAVFFAAAWGL